MPNPQVVFGAGHIHITQITDAQGNKITPPQVIAAPAVQNITADFGKADTKMMYGQKEFAIHAAQGKKSTEVSFEVGELYAQMLNALYFGQSVAAGSHVIYRDGTGSVVPENYSTNYKVKSVKTLQLSKWVSHTSATIAGVAATLETNETISAGKFKVSSTGVYSFSALDVGKTFALTYVALAGNSTTVVSTFKIPASLSWNPQLYSAHVSTKKTGVSGWFIRNMYNPKSIEPAAQHYQVASNGIYVFNSAEAVSVTTEHITDGVSVSSLIATLPTASYLAIIDPPASSVFVADSGVDLVSNAGTAMTGVAVGESLTKAATPTSGQYDATANGVYTFAAADIGDVVKISYVTDFEFINITAPGDGVFVEDKGVRNTDGMPLTRVELTSPISLLPNQYAVSAAGAYYFDTANRGDTLYIDYEYSSASGATLVMENNDMGSTPIVSLDISGKAEGQEWLIKYPRAIPKAFGFATKLDDYGMHKITYEVVADRVSNKVGTVYLTA